MVAISKITDRAYRGVDLVVGIAYTPPEGESLADLIISAVMSSVNLPADRVEVDSETGAIVATWEEETTRKLGVGATYEARFIRDLGGDTRVFYVRRVSVQ